MRSRVACLLLLLTLAFIVDACWARRPPTGHAKLREKRARWIEKLGRGAREECNGDPDSPHCRELKEGPVGPVSGRDANRAPGARLRLNRVGG